MLFQASNFADVQDNWGISFSTWNSGISLNKSVFQFKIKEIDTSGRIFTSGMKNLYNLDNERSCSDWIKEDIVHLKTTDAPQLTTAINIKQEGRGKLVKDALGYYVNVSNNVYKNSTDVYLLSCASSTANGISIMEENFYKVISNFAARRLISGTYINWINAKDEYCIPNMKNEIYKEWIKDALVYSLFNTASIQSSLRGIKYKDKKWDIINNFFFMSNKEVMSLAVKYRNDDIYYDCKNFNNERFVYEKIRNLPFSFEAFKVLEKARQLVYDSFSLRELVNVQHPEYNLSTWDAGWYQIKLILKEYMKTELEEFNILYKELEEKMRPLVYELGFLK
jgi:hypothetical protein